MEELIKQFNLPDYIMKAKSFSEASAMIMDKFKEREDPASKRTINEMMGRLRDAQEYIKAQVEPQNEQSIQQDVPQGGEQQFAYGGKSKGYNLGGLFEQAGNVVGGTAGDILGGASQGAAIGSVIPGIGTGVGAGVGALVEGISGLFGNNNEELKMQRQQAQGNRNQVLNTYNYGGSMNKYQNGGLEALDLQSRGIVRPGPDFDTNLASTTPTPNERPGFLQRLGNDINIAAGDIGDAVGPALSQAGDFLEDNTSALRYAPTAINALQASNLERPAPTTLDRLGNAYSPQYADEQALQNIAREQFNTTNEALAGASGGSTSALRSNILASGLNRARSVSDAYQRAEAANRAENRAGQQFNLGVDRSNLGQSNLETDINARDAGAYETAKAGSLARLGQDLGAIGKEEAQADLIERLYGYDRRGNYLNKRRPRARTSGITPRAPQLSNTPFNPLSLNLNR